MLRLYKTHFGTIARGTWREIVAWSQISDPERWNEAMTTHDGYLHPSDQRALDDANTAIEYLKNTLDDALEENRRLEGQLQRHRDLLELVLLFYHQGRWYEHHRAQWNEITGQAEATTKVLCDAIRAAGITITEKT